MVKKNPKTVLKEGTMNLFEEFKQSIIEFVSDFMEVQMRSLASFIRNVPLIKEKIRKSVTAFVLAFSGFLLLLFGFSDYVAQAFATDPAVMKIIVGSITIGVAVLYSRS